MTVEGVTVLVGDALEQLRRLPAASVDCVATSPPFYGLRDYDVDGQIGLEETPEQWAASLVAVFAEARRVLRDTGTLWVECGDSYVSGQGGRQSSVGELPPSTRFDRKDAGTKREGLPSSFGERDCGPRFYPGRDTGLKPKDLLGQPWLLAFALRADGWWLRQAIVWHKPNAMPESAKDRCTTAHSYVFLFSKRPRYWFDADAIAEPAEWARWGDQTVPKYEGTDTATGWMQPKTKAELEAIRTAGNRNEFRGGGAYTAGRSHENGTVVENRTPGNDGEPHGMKNARSVWTIATKGYPGAHYATWPEALATRIIRAGCPRWVCATCGKPRTRIVDIEVLEDKERHDHPSSTVRHGPLLGYAGGVPQSHHTTLGWSDCGHDNYAPGVVLDPFGGSGTTGVVALRENRHAVLIELNERYVTDDLFPRIQNWHRDPVRPRDEPTAGQLTIDDSSAA